MLTQRPPNRLTIPQWRAARQSLLMRGRRTRLTAYELL
jgi:hypothetical protein